MVWCSGQTTIKLETLVGEVDALFGQEPGAAVVEVPNRNCSASLTQHMTQGVINKRLHTATIALTPILWRKTILYSDATCSMGWNLIPVVWDLRTAYHNYICIIIRIEHQLVLLIINTPDQLMDQLRQTRLEIRM